jgi:hypothetical protein
VSQLADYREEMRAQTRLINAMRADFVDLRGDVNDTIGNMRGEMRAGFSAIAGMLEQLGAARPDEGDTPAE